MPQLLPIPHDPWVFVTDCVWTVNEHSANKGQEAIQPLVGEGDDYLEFLTRRWQKRGRQQWKKSRQLRVTWLLAALMLHEALDLRGIRDGYQAKKFEDADAYLRDRFWFIYQHIPVRYIKPRARYISGVIEVFHDADTVVPTSQIMALAEGANQVRQFTFSRLWRDEAAFQVDQKESHGAAQPSLDGGGADLKTSSSAGSRTFFYSLAEEDVAPGPITDKAEVFKGITAWQRNGYDHLFVHYSADPKKRPGTPTGDAWLESTKSGQPTDLWRREMEGDDSVEPGLPVFCDTDRIKIVTQEIRGWLKFFGGWDPGFLWPFSYALQLEPVEDQQTKRKDIILHVLHEFVKPNTEIYEFGMWVKAERERLYGKRDWQDYGDDASKHRTETGQTAQILASMGINILSEPTGPGGVVKGNALVQRMISGRCVEIDPQCKFLITAVKSGYVKDEEGKPVTGMEGHPYCDAVDAGLRYPCQNLLSFEYQTGGTQRMIPGQELPGVRPAANLIPALSPLTHRVQSGSTRPVEAERHTGTVWVPKRFDPKAPVRRGGR